MATADVPMAQVKSIWRDGDRFWLEVDGEDARYGVHFVEPEEGS